MIQASPFSMSETIHYFFTSVSPFAWFGHQQVLEIAARHDKHVAFRPVDLASVWEHSGSVPLARRSETRKRYRLIELRRIAEFRGLDIKVQPRHFPADPTLADHCVIAIGEQGEDPAGFAFAVGEAVWALDMDIADPRSIAILLQQCGHDPKIILDHAGRGETARVRQANTRAAVEADAVGAPSYVYEGEVFWGQDRLDLLERMIASGRGPFRAE